MSAVSSTSSLIPSSATNLISRDHLLIPRSAGTKDSALTNHGVLQATRLGQHFLYTDVKISHLFSSDLQRAYKTAEALLVTQRPSPSAANFSTTEIKKLALLREQDFGYFEGRTFFSRKEAYKSGKQSFLEAHKHDPGFQDVEAKESMIERCNVFIDVHLQPLFDDAHKCKDGGEEHGIAIVSHGVLLSHLWRAILVRFPRRSVVVEPGAVQGTVFSLEHLGGWSNTGYLELELKPRALKGEAENASGDREMSGGNKISGAEKKETRKALDYDVAPDDPLMVHDNREKEKVEAQTNQPSAQEKTPKLLEIHVKAVNSLKHLEGLKKTRGGIGSARHDEGQKTLETFFKKRRLE
jgi:broad specificity phosphatase PhoE